MNHGITFETTASPEPEPTELRRTDNQEPPSRRNSRPSNATSGFLLGALGGAGLAILRGRSVFRGAVDGASLGLMAGNVLDVVGVGSEECDDLIRRGNNGNSGGSSSSSSNGAMDLSGLSYEQLLER